MKIGFKIKCRFLLLLLALCSGLSFAQKKDSLIAVLEAAKNDTNKVTVLNLLCNIVLSGGNFDEAEVYGKRADSLAKALNYNNGRVKANLNLGNIASDRYDYNTALKFYIRAYRIAEGKNYKGMANAVKNIGIIYFYLGDYERALDFYSKALKMYEVIDFKEGMASCLGNMGLISNSQGNYPNALQYYLKALKLQEQAGNPNGIAAVNIYIGNIYSSMREHKKALSYFLNAAKITDQAGNKKMSASAYNNIGIAKEELGDLTGALENYKISNGLSEQINDKKGHAASLTNIGIVYKKRDDLKNAAGYFLRSLEESKETDDKYSIIVSCTGLGETYIKGGNYSKAEEYIKRGLALAVETGHMEGRKNCAQAYSEICSRTNRPREALRYYEEYIMVRDSLQNEENTKKIVQQQMQYDFDKKETATKAMQAKKDLATRAEAKKQKVIIYVVSAGIFVLLIMAIVIFRSLRVNQKKNRIISLQKEAVERQKNLVEEHQKEILDSIHYAKRIQIALLPTAKYIERYLK